MRVLFLLNHLFPFSQSKTTTHDSDDIYINTPSRTCGCSSHFWTNGFSITTRGRVRHHAESSDHFRNQPGGLAAVMILPDSVNRDVFKVLLILMWNEPRPLEGAAPLGTGRF